MKDEKDKAKEGMGRSEEPRETCRKQHVLTVCG